MERRFHACLSIPLSGKQSVVQSVIFQGHTVTYRSLDRVHSTRVNPLLGPSLRARYLEVFTLGVRGVAYLLLRDFSQNLYL